MDMGRINWGRPWRYLHNTRIARIKWIEAPRGFTLSSKSSLLFSKTWPSRLRTAFRGGERETIMRASRAPILTWELED